MFNLKHVSVAFLAVLTICSGVWAGDYQPDSRMDLYQAQARRYVADRTRRVQPRTRLVTTHVNYAATAPTRQLAQAQLSGQALAVQPVAYNAPTRVVIQDIAAGNQSVVRDGVVTDAAPSAYAGYDIDHATIRTDAVYVSSPTVIAYDSTPVRYSASYYTSRYDRCGDYYPYRPSYRARVIYRGGYDRCGDFYPAYRYRCRPRYDYGYRCRYPRYPRHCGSDWGFYIHIRF